MFSFITRKIKVQKAQAVTITANHPVIEVTIPTPQQFADELRERWLAGDDHAEQVFEDLVFILNWTDNYMMSNLPLQLQWRLWADGPDYGIDY